MARYIGRYTICALVFLYVDLEMGMLQNKGDPND